MADSRTPNDAVLGRIVAGMRTRRVPFDPKPKGRTGTCVVCGGKVQEDFIRVTDTPVSMIPLGPGSRGHYYWSSSGLACVDCGIKYAKVPTPKLKAKGKRKR